MCHGEGGEEGKKPTREEQKHGNHWKGRGGKIDCGRTHTGGGEIGSESEGERRKQGKEVECKQNAIDRRRKYPERKKMVTFHRKFKSKKKKKRGKKKGKAWKGEGGKGGG